MIIMFAALSSLWPSRAPVHTYMYDIIRNHYCMHHCASKLIININIDVIKFYNSHCYKSSKKNERRQVNEKFPKLERGYRDCIKRTRDKIRIYSIPHDAPGA